jgi:putative sigma-54 modulation protein
MQTTVTFKKIDPSDPLKSYVNKKLDKFDKMLDSPAEAHVVLSVEKIRHIAEITLTCDKLNIHATEASENMYSSIDILMDKVRAQIKKHKEKIKRHMSGKKKSLTDTAEFDLSPMTAAERDVPHLTTWFWKPLTPSPWTSLMRSMSSIPAGTRFLSSTTHAPSN